MRSVVAFPLCAALALLAMTTDCGCAPPPDVPPTPPRDCDDDGLGCLPDEQCIGGVCVAFERCESDDDCPTSAYTCTFPSQVCELRAGFGLECDEDSDCDQDQFCALGICRDVAGARTCARRSDCPLGQSCDRVHFFCIDDGPCTISEDYPELACDPGETCDAVTAQCNLPCQEECTTATQEEDCGFGKLCDGSCRCVQCLTTADCGPGLICNVRAGRCESENLCFSNDDCEAPLVCVASTSLCQVPPPPCEDDFDCAFSEICNRVTGACELPDGLCFDDRFEDADTPANAEELTLNEGPDPTVLEDLVLCPDDDDVYAVSLQPGDNLVATVSDTAVKARATIWLLDSAGETSVDFAEAPPFGNGTVSTVAQTAETVFVRVNALLGQSPYVLTLNKNPGEACVADVFEGMGGNDDVTTATAAGTFPLGAPFSARVCPADDDHFAVSLAQGEGLQVNLAFAPNLDLDLAIVDVATDTVLKQGGGITVPETLVYRTNVNRQVTVRVNGFGNDFGPYTLQLQKLPPVMCVADAYEPDPYDRLALEEEENEEPTSDGGMSTADAGAFAADGGDLEDSGTSDSGTPDSGSPDAGLSDSGAGMDAGAADAGPQTDAGTAMDAGDAPEGDAGEPMAEAIVVPVEQDFGPLTRSLCVDDIDQLEIPLLDFERVVALAEFNPVDLNLNMRIESDDAEREVLASAPPSSGGGSVAYAPGENRTVQLVLESRFNTKGDYTLHIFKENALTCAPDVLEPNNFVQQAAIPPLAPTVLSLCGPDEDIFMVEGVAGKILHADIAFSTADGDLDLMVLGVNGSQVLGVSDGVGNGEALDVPLPVDGIYFVRVFSLSAGSKASYLLNVNLTAP